LKTQWQQCEKYINHLKKRYSPNNISSYKKLIMLQKVEKVKQIVGNLEMHAPSAANRTA
jgi:hypothetical protein